MICIVTRIIKISDRLFHDLARWANSNILVLNRGLVAIDNNLRYGRYGN